MSIDVQVGTTRCKGIVPRLIQFAQGGDPNVHAFVQVRILPSPGEVHSKYIQYSVSAEPEGLKRRELNYWGADNPTSDLDLDEQSVQKMHDFIEAELALRAGYDFGDDGVLGLDMLAKKYVPWFPRAIFRWAERRYSKGKLLMCSQFAVDVLRAGGLDPWPGLASGSIAPRDIHTWLRKMGWAE